MRSPYGRDPALYGHFHALLCLYAVEPTKSPLPPFSKGGMTASVPLTGRSLMATGHMFESASLLAVYSPFSTAAAFS